MDDIDPPNETLRLFRERLANYETAVIDDDADAWEACAVEAMRHAEDLFEWLAKGGYPPDWTICNG